MGETYLTFAEEEPAYYAAIFETRGIHAAPESEGRPSPFDLLVEALQATFTDGFGGVAPRFIALEVWALAHGIATLSAAGHLPTGPGCRTNTNCSGPACWRWFTVPRRGIERSLLSYPLRGGVGGGGGSGGTAELHLASPQPLTPPRKGEMKRACPRRRPHPNPADRATPETHP